MEENTLKRRSIRMQGYDYTSPGVYFVTITSFRREEIFGTIADGRVELSPIGKIIQTEWFRSAEIRKEIHLFEDEFVVMPNHIHGIVWIVEMDAVGADGIHPDVRPVDRGAVGANGVRPKDGIQPVDRDTVGANGIRPVINGTRQTGTHLVDKVNVGVNGVHPMDGIQPVNRDAVGANGIRPVIDGTRHTGTRRVPLRMALRSLSSFIAGFKAAVTSRAGRELNSGNIWQRNYYEHIIRNEAEFEKIWNYIDSNPLQWETDKENPLNQGTLSKKS